MQPVPNRGRPDGRPCWTELAGAPTEAQLGGYASVLGWTFDENTHVGGYRRSWAGEWKVAGFGGPELPRPQAGWRSYLSTSHLTDSLRRVAAAGGTLVTGPVDVSPDGIFALVVDPAGVVLGLFQPGTDPGTREGDDRAGCVAGWVLESPDPAASVAFHRALFGSWRHEVPVVPSTSGDGAWRACFALPAGEPRPAAGRVWPSGDSGDSGASGDSGSGLREMTDGAGNRFLVRPAGSGDAREGGRPRAPPRARPGVRPAFRSAAW